MILALTVLAVLILLLANEWWWRWRDVHGEFSRKFIHITVGSFVAVWPFFLSWGEIQFLSLAFFVVVSLSKYFNIFQAIHSVQRPTWGEVYFAAAVGATTLITTNEWIYAAALLQMSLGDGLAAVIGSRFGAKRRYSVFGHNKSLVGTIAFFAVSLAILAVFNQHLPVTLSLGLIVVISALASLLENIGRAGLDNLLVPVTVAAVLANI